MYRFFIKKENIIENEAAVIGEDVKHISNVLRLATGDKIILCDGEGKDYLVSIRSVEKKQIRTKIISEEESSGEIEIEIVIYQGIPKAAKMELIIQKCTELGASKIVPVLTERTVVKFDSKKEEIKKIERWQKIAEEAAKQSGRGKIPVIHKPMSFENALADASSKELVLLPYELEKRKVIKQVLKREKPVSIGIFIGPEGGFDTKEIQLALKTKADIITLGDRILRTETVAFTVLSIILYEFDQI